MNTSSKKFLFILILSIFIFKFVYSLTNEFWFHDQDVLQIYLIGLKYFTTGGFPYFGPDLVYTHTQIPGGLQAFLVSSFWFIKKFPEAPYITLNILQFGSLFLFGWYLRKRVANFPAYLLWLFVLFMPWMVCYATRIINPSYVVPGSILFFIGIYEIYPQLRLGIISQKLSFYMIGFALLWIFQLHMSWVLLLPYILFAFIVNYKENNFRRFSKNLLFFILGCLTTGITVIPTFIKFGISSSGGASGSMNTIQFNPNNLLYIFDYLIKFISYSAFDTSRFIGGDTAQRIAFLKDYLWAAPAVVIVSIAGILQVLTMIIYFFKKNVTKNWKYVKYFTLSALIFVWLSSAFSVTKPSGHATLILFPVIMIYAIHCLEPLLHKKFIRISLNYVFILTFIMYIAIGIKNYKTISIYKNRAVIVKALQENNYKLVGSRRYEK